MMMRWFVVLGLVLGILAPDISRAQQAAPAEPVRYLDVTARTDGWDFGQGLAISGSGKNQIVVVSYLDEATTAPLFKIAASFAAPPRNLPIFGFVRSSAPPANLSQLRNPLGFAVYFNGVALPPMENPDPRFTRAEQLGAALQSIQRIHFAARDNGCFDIAREPGSNGGLRIPPQVICPIAKPQSP